MWVLSILVHWRTSVAAGLVIHFLGPGCARIAPRISPLLPDDWPLCTGGKRGPVAFFVPPQPGHRVGLVTRACPCHQGWEKPSGGQSYKTTQLVEAQREEEVLPKLMTGFALFLLPPWCSSSCVLNDRRKERWRVWTGPLSALLTLPVFHVELKSERTILFASTASPCLLTPPFPEGQIG